MDAFQVNQSLDPNNIAGFGSGTGGLDKNALFSILLGGQSLMNYGKDTSKPLDVTTPMSSYFSNINNAKMLKMILEKNKLAQGQGQGQDIMSMIKQAFGPDESSIKIDSKGLTQFQPNTSPMLKGFLGGDSFTENPSLAPSTPKSGGIAKTVSPFGDGQSDISASDLVGLSPQDIGMMVNALQNKEKMGLERDQLANKSVKDIFDMMNIASEIKHRNRPDKVESLDQPFAINALSKPEGTTLREWIALPDESKRRSMFEHTGKLKGLSDAKIEELWSSSNETERSKFIKEALKDPKIMAGAERLAKAGAPITNIGDIAKVERTKDQVKRESKVRDPGFAADIIKGADNWDVTESMKDIAKRSGLSIKDEKVRKAAIAGRHRELMNNEILQAFPNAKFERGVGWIDNQEVVVRDPYATK